MNFLILENELLRLTLWLNKGADVVELRYKPTDVDVLWHTQAPMHCPGEATATAPGALGSFFDHYYGGWQEIMPGGGPYTFAGAAVGIHGEAALLPWSFTVLADAPNCICVLLRCPLVRTPFELTKKLTLCSGSNVIDFFEVLHNSSPQSIPYLWGQHPAFGAPLIGEGTKLHLDAAEVLACGKQHSPGSVFAANSLHKWPLLQDTNGNAVDMSILSSEQFERTELLHVTKLNAPWYAITNPACSTGVGFCWEKSQFPYVWIWHGFAGEQGYPFWGKSRALAVEFWSGYPNSFAAAEQNGTLKHLAGGESTSTAYKCILFDKRDTVCRITPDGTVI